ncbi:MAG: hypothetical protein LQ342_002866 [Letrouitia transgressa]|nr:MAG: hypothetical protein LQ342_002866 [Letrouitia transgressa]
METITIPSPSAFINSPVLQLSSPPTKKSKTATKKQSKPAKTDQSSRGNQNGAAKPKQSKSRNGCVTCKSKRLKCDETKPMCQQCQKRNVTCGGYKKDFKWRPFGEAPFQTKSTTSTEQNASNTKSRAAKLAGSACSNASSETIRSTMPLAKPNTGCLDASNLPIDTQLAPSAFGPGPLSFPCDQRGEPSSTMSFFDSYHTPSFTSSTDTSMFDDGSTLNSVNTTASDLSGDPSPRIEDLMLPGSDALCQSPNQRNVPIQDDIFCAIEDGLQNQADPLDFDDDVEEIHRIEDPVDAWAIPISLPCPSDSSSSPGSISPRDSFMEFLNSPYDFPRLSLASPDMLLMRFDQFTCGILSVKDGPNENPWRTMVWPLAQTSPALYHAIIAMTAFHTSKHRKNLRVVGVDHMRKSLQHLANGLETMQTDAALATTLALAFSESWDQHISTGIEHLRGAKTLVNRALKTRDQNAMNPEDLDRLRFLCNTWVYMDVIARLTSVDDDESNDFDNAVNLPCGPLGENNIIDPLMGCASTLFPLIGRVANLVRKVMKSGKNSMNVISQATELKAAIEAWKPPPFFQQPVDPTSTISDSLKTAEAYRWATLLYLHQAVPEIPSQTTEQLAQRVLVYLVAVPLGSRAIIVHIYPLLAAGCEVTGHEDRAWVEDRWEAMSQRMFIGNIDKCWEVVKEVWDRRDLDEAEKARQRHRRVPSRLPKKRKFSSHEKPKTNSTDTGGPFNWDERLEGAEARLGLGRMDPASATNAHRRMNFSDSLEDLDYEKTVRGRLHWVGVMKDWKWEVLLG